MYGRASQEGHSSVGGAANRGREWLERVITKGESAITVPWGDDVIILNQMHLRQLLSQYARYYHEDRTHLGLGKDTLGGSVRSSEQKDRRWIVITRSPTPPANREVRTYDLCSGSPTL
jgi:hypothetical protein